MPAKWQQWMPFKIDAFKGSASVQAMHPAARIGYLYLLSSQWQSEDGTISSDPIDLADESGLGDELWALHSTRILRKFDQVPDKPGRLRNAVCHQEWLEAERVFNGSAERREHVAEKRRHSGTQGATSRWGQMSGKTPGEMGGKTPSSLAKSSSSRLRAERLAIARQKGTHTNEEWEALLAFCGNKCVRCGKSEFLVKDHITPIYIGGSDGIDNLQPLCRTCNSSKGPECRDYRQNGWQKCLDGWQTSGFTGTVTETETNKNQEQKIYAEPAAPALPESVPKRPKAKRESTPDPRHTEFRQDFEKAFQHANGVPAPWDGKESARLSHWLKSSPTINREQWRAILQHRHVSPVNKASPLSVWISRALSWLNSPADEWGKPIGAQHGNTPRNSAADAAMQNLRELLHERPAEDSGGPDDARRQPQRDPIESLFGHDGHAVVEGER